MLSLVRLRPKAGYLLTVLSIGAVMGLFGDSTAATSLPIIAYTALVVIQGHKIQHPAPARRMPEPATA